jgi:hypothetical protein
LDILIDLEKNLKVTKKITGFLNPSLKKRV